MQRSGFDQTCECTDKYVLWMPVSKREGKHGEVGKSQGCVWIDNNLWVSLLHLPRNNTLNWPYLAGVFWMETKRTQNDPNTFFSMVALHAPKIFWRCPWRKAVYHGQYVMERLAAHDLTTMASIYTVFFFFTCHHIWGIAGTYEGISYCAIITSTICTCPVHLRSLQEKHKLKLKNSKKRRIGLQG